MSMALSTVINAHRMASYAVFSSSLVALVVVNGFRKHSNFYSIAVYLSRSNGSVLALANFGLLLTLVAGRACQRVFFGPLRAMEVERLYDRMWFFVTESLLAFTIFRDEFDTPFVVMFVLLLFLKCFHWVVADRIDWMDQVPFPGPGTLFHIRTVSLLFTLWVCDLVLSALALESLFAHGVGWIILFASEYGILLASLLNAWLKYLIAAYDLRRARLHGGENAPLWEDKSMYIFYVELLTDFLKLFIYLVFFGAVMTFYGLPLNVVRDVYITARSFVTRVQDLIRYRSATKNMDQRYPNATQAELDATSDRTCIICREEMVPAGGTSADAPAPAPANGAAAVPAAAAAPPPSDGPNDTPKKLPCGHIFHFHCLRSWLERQQSCPTCRRSVLETTPTAHNHPAAPAQAVPAPPAPGAQPNAAGNAGEQNFMDADALLERLGLRQPGEGRNGGGRDAAAAPAGPQTTGATGSSGRGMTPPPAPPPPPRTFQGFNVGGVWQPWNYGAPQPTPTVPLGGSNAEASSSSSTSSAADAQPEATPASGEAPGSPVAPVSNLTPREAAAAAALRRATGGGVAAASATPSASTKAVAPSSALRSSSTTASSSSYSSISAPTLIPLFDPAAISTHIAQRLPFSYGAPFAGFPFSSQPSTNHFQPSVPPLSVTMPSSGSVDSAELSRVDRLTRESIDERLKILDEVQSSLWKCAEDLTRMKSVLPSGGDAGVVDGKGKEKE